MHTEIVFKMTDRELHKQSLQWKSHKTWMLEGLEDSHTKEELHKPWIWLGERQIGAVSLLSFKEDRDKKMLGERESVRRVIFPFQQNVDQEGKFSAETNTLVLFQNQ